jgi:pimeloyl-ACP methyl ester carboxylesterase
MARRAESDSAGARPAPEPPSPEPEPEPPGRWVEGPAGRLFVHTAGEAGTPLLLVHGLAGNGAQWQAQLAGLGGRCRVVAPDLRAHGRSEAPAGADYAIGDYAADVLAVADALGLARFVLAGHSLGAAVAVEIAAAHPDRVLALGLVDPGGDVSDDPALEATLADVAADPRASFTIHYRGILHGGRPSTQRRVLADLAAVPDAALAPSLAASMRFPVRARLAAYPGPELCLASPLNDTPQGLPRQLPGLPVEWLAPASHWLMLDRPEQTNYLLGQLVEAAGKAVPAAGSAVAGSTPAEPDGGGSRAARPRAGGSRAVKPPGRASGGGKPGGTRSGGTQSRGSKTGGSKSGGSKSGAGKPGGGGPGGGGAAR